MFLFVLPEVPEDYTVKEAELKMGSLLGLCRGKAPTSTQVQQCGMEEPGAGAFLKRIKEKDIGMCKL